ncbi:Uma2 family endonuclease [Streptoalloteichus hindustanus]|uniref:Restriction endonuclease n=1 Tax=Streptoalloteichus hindustanus TaxID=2017 RepID=A0A1M5BQA7_STRHI|nr:Uma2 family endonuclease [Streptoalloteichus hindustanus]SHF44783.1 hypothetical protein SAMN05444320_103686 [Streptoalloteichus hindustanus]
MEIVSPGSRKQDRTLKPMVLAEAGVPHFWRVELIGFREQLPGERPPVVFAHMLSDAAYALVMRAGAGTVVTLPGPIPLSVDPGGLLLR